MARRRKLISHDSVQLRPRTVFDGPTLEFSFPDMKVGVAEYEEGRTGCTFFHFPKGVSTAVDIRGGSVGASETGYGWYHANQPFHTQYDGDILYAVTTNEVTTKTLDELDIGFIASELAWDAVLTSFAEG